MVAWVPSQNGLFDDPPHRHSATGSGWSITRPSMSVSVIGPLTMYGPSSLGVILASGMCWPLLQWILDGLGQGGGLMRVPVSCRPQDRPHPGERSSPDQGDSE